MENIHTPEFLPYLERNVEVFVRTIVLQVCYIFNSFLNFVNLCPECETNLVTGISYMCPKLFFIFFVHVYR